MCWRRCTEPGGCAGRETPEELSLCLQDAGLRSLPGAWACTVPLPGAAARASGLGPPAPLSVFCLRVRWWQPVFPAVQAVGARSPAARLLRFRTRCPPPAAPHHQLLPVAAPALPVCGAGRSPAPASEGPRLLLGVGAEPSPARWPALSAPLCCGHSPRGRPPHTLWGASLAHQPPLPVLTYHLMHSKFCLFSLVPCVWRASPLRKVWAQGRQQRVSLVALGLVLSASCGERMGGRVRTAGCSPMRAAASASLDSRL